MFKQPTPLVLGSSSPRRIDFLEQYNLQFTIIKPEIEELVRSKETAHNFVQRMAKEKNKAVQKICLEKDLSQHCILTADTVVVLDHNIIGKPNSPDDVLPILQQLNGKWHTVLSAYAVGFTNKKEIDLEIVKTRVQFKQNQANLLQSYARTEEPLDKAGAYSIQGVGAMLVGAIEGSYTNVIGLPIANVLEKLLSHQVITI